MPNVNTSNHHHGCHSIETRQILDLSHPRKDPKGIVYVGNPGDLLIKFLQIFYSHRPVEAFQLFGLALGEALRYRFRFLVRRPRSRVQTPVVYRCNGGAMVFSTIFSGFFFQEVGDLFS